MEVILARTTLLQALTSILHVCGGDPMPHDDQVDSATVFSTYVEVIPMVLVCLSLLESILHVCGGDPGTCPKLD